MPGAIQSIERAAAVLRAVGIAGRPLELAEIAQALELPKATAHGIVRTLKNVGFLHQDAASSAYTLGTDLRNLGRASVDPNDVRSVTTNFADALAARTRREVLVAMPGETGAQVVLHVFRPDDTAQRARVGEVLPYHATALGKAALAFAPSVANQALELHRYTHRTVHARTQLDAALDRTRADGFATEYAEHDSDGGGIAAPLRAMGGLGIGAVAVVGPVEDLFDSGSRPRTELVRETMTAATAMSHAITTPR